MHVLHSLGKVKVGLPVLDSPLRIFFKSDFSPGRVCCDCLLLWDTAAPSAAALADEVRDAHRNKRSATEGTTCDGKLFR
jgi:hypothetical protein